MRLYPRPHSNTWNSIHHRVLYCQARPQTFIRSQVLHLTSKKLAHRFIPPVFVIGDHPLYVHLASTWHLSRDRCSQASPVFHALPLPCIILNTNWKKKNGGGLETRLVRLYEYSYDPSNMLKPVARNKLFLWTSVAYMHQYLPWHRICSAFSIAEWSLNNTWETKKL